VRKADRLVASRRLYFAPSIFAKCEADKGRGFGKMRGLV